MLFFYDACMRDKKVASYSVSENRSEKVTGHAWCIFDQVSEVAHYNYSS